MVTYQNTVMIDFKATVEGFNKKMKEAHDNMQAVAKSNKDFSKAGLDTSATRAAMALDAQNKNLARASQLMNETGLTANQLSIGLKRMGYTLKGGKIFDAFGKQLKKTEIDMKGIVKSSKRFNMSLLSIMFAGMALQRLGKQMLRSLTTTFQKANEDTEGLGKATWHLQAAWEFFKYSMVEALTQSPLFQMLVQWLLQIVMWLNKLPASAKAFILIGIVILFVIGTLMLLIGQIGLFIGGLAQMGIIGTTTATSLASIFMWVGIVLVVIIALWMTNLGNFQEFVKSTLGIIWITFKNVFGHLWKMVKAVFGFIKAIFKGDFDEAQRYFVMFVKNLIALFAKLGVGITAIFNNVGEFLRNVLIDALQFALNGAIFLINKLIRQINRIPGVKIPLIPAVDLSGFKHAYTTMEDVKAKFEGIEKRLGLDIAIPAPSTPSSSEGAVDNRQFNIDMNVNVPDNGPVDVKALSDNIMNSIGDQLNRLMDSNNT